MNYILDLLIVSLFISACANLALYLLLTRVKKKKPEMSYDCRMLLADLATGPALVKIDYVDRGEVFLRSPRQT